MPTTRYFIVMVAIAMGNLDKIIILKVKVRHIYLSSILYSVSPLRL